MASVIITKPVLVFVGLVLGGGWALHRGYRSDPLGHAHACHAVFLMIFLESSLDFPDDWYLHAPMGPMHALVAKNQPGSDAPSDDKIERDSGKIQGGIPSTKNTNT